MEGQRSGHTATPKRAIERALVRCQSGAVSAEYLMVFAISGLSLALTLASLGPGTVQTWAASRRILYGPSP